MKLVATPHGRSAELAVSIYASVLEEVRGDVLVRRAASLESNVLSFRGIGGAFETVDLTGIVRVFVCGAGKASVGMARALEEMLRERVAGGLVVTRRGDTERLTRIEVIEAAHPVPDDTSIAAGRRMVSLLSSLNPDDLLIFCLSGGASSLMELPVDGVSLEDLQLVNRHLISGGFDIGKVNLARRQLSQIKGGGLAGACRARMCCLVLSDVIGNDLSVVGSGPFFASSQPEAYSLARSSGVLAALPAGYDRFFKTPTQEPSGRVPHVIVGSILVALQAAQSAAAKLGLKAIVEPKALSADSREAGRLVLSGPFGPGICKIFGGETTSVVHGNGKGGRCQELACQAALLLEGQPNVAVLAAGTDGSDGPTDAAGAVVDQESVARAALKGISAEEELMRSNSYAFHKAAETLIKTGPTQSNVNDLVLVVQAQD